MWNYHTAPSPETFWKFTTSEDERVLQKYLPVADPVAEYTGGVLVSEDFFKNFFTPDKIIHNRKTDETIVLWKDGTKTIVKPMSGELYSPYSAFTAALAKKIFDTNSQVNKVVGMTIEPGKKCDGKVKSLGEKLKESKKELKKYKQMQKNGELMGESNDDT